MGKHLATAVLAASFLAGQTLAASNDAASNQSRKPPPPPAYPSQSQFKEAARRMGVGGCDDLLKIKAAPQQEGEYGADAYWDRIAVHPHQYRACLIDGVSNRRLVRGISFGPGTPASTVGDVAHALLVEAGFIPWGLCLPSAVSGSALGAVAAHDWLRKPGNRAWWETCIRRALVPDTGSSRRRPDAS